MKLDNHDNKNIAILTPIKSQESIPWLLHLTVCIIGVFIISIMIYGFHLGNYMIEKYAPLVDAAMEIKLEATTAHLWFEEIISGDSSEDLNMVKEHLNLAQWYATSILEGGENTEGIFIPLEDPILRAEIEVVTKKITDFREITFQRFDAIQESQVGTPIDQQYDRIFRDFINQTDRVESGLQDKIAAKIKLSKIIQVAIIIISFLSVGVILLVLHRFDKRQKINMQLVNETNENLQQALQEIKTLQGIIPICSYCKSIRDEKGVWNQLELYIHEHSEAQFSHGACPECLRKQMEALESYN